MCKGCKSKRTQYISGTEKVGVDGAKQGRSVKDEDGEAGRIYINQILYMSPQSNGNLLRSFLEADCLRSANWPWWPGAGAIGFERSEYIQDMFCTFWEVKLARFEN